MSKLLTLFDETRRGADVSFNGPMLGIPYELARLGATYTRASTKAVYQNDAIVTLASGQFGTTYDSVTGLYAYDPEPAATNLATNSAGAAATWTVSNIVDAVTPISGFAASLQFGDNSVQRSATKSISVTSGTTYSISVFIQMDDDSAPSVGSTNAAGDLSITLNSVIATANLLVRRIGPNSNVYRISGSIVASATASHAAGFIKHTGQSAKPFRIIGIQVETNARSTSYIATAGATATRAADVLSVPLANIPGFSQTQGAVVFSYRLIQTPLSTNVLGEISLLSNPASNHLSHRITTTPAARFQCFDGGISQAGINAAGAISTSSVNKFGFSYQQDNFLACLNGGAVGTDAAGVIPIVDTFTIGCTGAGTLQPPVLITGLRLLVSSVDGGTLQSLTT